MNNKNKGIIISVVSGIVILALCIGAAGSYFSSKVLAKQAQTQTTTGVKTANPISKDIPDMFAGYMRRMQMKIKTNWEPPKQESSKRVVVFYTIKKNGKLGSYKIITSSGNKELDKAAIKALKKSAPFEPLPEGFTKDHVDIQFTFDYNVWKNKQKY
jgi:TonB family protein